MKLYHGTDGRFLGNILKSGLRPRGVNGRNNWKHVEHQSNPKGVYLTNCYAPYFAFNAAGGKNPICAVVEVDTDKLDTSNLFPDEDCLEQVGRGKDDVPGNMSQRTLHYRKLQHTFHGILKDCENGEPCLLDWQDSLSLLGTCIHIGTIPPTAITRAVRWPHIPNIWMRLVFDPTITLINQCLCGERYKELTRKLFYGDFKKKEEKTDPFNKVYLPELKNLETINLISKTAGG